jgi:uncharacterized protein YkwD
MRPAILALALATLGACAPATAPSPAAQATPARAASALTAELTATRAARGAPALRRAPALDTAARRHADWIAATGAYGHRGAGGTRVGDRVSAQGYCWSAVGENIAHGMPSREAALRGWLASSAHRRNLLMPRFTEYGLAGAGGYWVMILARPC